MQSIKVLQIGMGPLGVKVAEFIEERAGIDTVMAVDRNPELVGQRLIELSPRLSSEVAIVEELPSGFPNGKPDVAVITTVSDMSRIVPQIEEVVTLGIPVVSTCEELSYPWQEAPALAARIDEAAKKNGVAVVGTGVNPGFLMDALPTMLTAVCQNVERVIVRRFQDASFRRLPFQKKIGSRLSPAAFNEKKDDGSLRHVGLTESIQFIAGHLGWELDRVEDVISPVLVETEAMADKTDIQQGYARGVHQMGRGWSNGEEKITLEFKAAIGEPESYDEVEIIGLPNISSRIQGGVNGDVATCAITINTIGALLKAQAGLHTMGSLPLTSFFLPREALMELA